MSTLDPAHRNILEHELGQALEERERLDAAIEYLQRRLGVASNGAGSQTELQIPQQAGSLASLPNVADSINPMQFYGLSVAKASAEVLRLVGRSRPLSTREIYDAITKGGVSVKSTEVVGKMMKRSKTFHQLRRSIWGLAEWYPASVVARGNTDSDLQPDADDETPADLEDSDGEVSGESG